VYKVSSLRVHHFMRLTGSRYELGGTPLPYASDAVFNRLFPVPKSAAVTVTGSVFGPTGPKRTFSLDTIPECQQCRSPRIFECQLMPNLINAVKPTVATKAISDEERRKQVEKELTNKGGMEWGTCMIFSCEGDCETVWAEEYVAVQWE
jgi:pre-rRNA-processing protein TSR4